MKTHHAPDPAPFDPPLPPCRCRPLRLVVSCDGYPLHRVTPYQFVNSPEWEADEAAERVSKELDGEQSCKPPDPNPIYQVRDR